MDHWRQFLVNVCEPSVAEAHYADFRESLVQLDPNAFADTLRKALQASLANVPDKSSVLSLRDWVCARIAESRRKQPLHPSTIRQLMDTLRNAAGPERAAVALGFAERECHGSPVAESQVVEQLMSTWAAGHVPIAGPILTRALKAMPLSAQSLVLFAHEAACGPLDFLRMLQRASEGRFAVPSRWVGACRIPSSSVIPSGGLSSLPSASEMFIMQQNGSLQGAGRSMPPPKACVQLGNVLAAASVPLSAWIVALLHKPSGPVLLVLWSALDPQSYAILNDFEEDAPDTVDAQLTPDGDVHVRTGTRAEDGSAARLQSFCVRMSGTDVSTLRHVDVDEEAMALLLLQRGALGAVNHMDHGNVLAVESAYEEGRFVYRAWYGSHCAEFPTEPIAVFGNHAQAYAWTADSMLRCTKLESSKRGNLWASEKIASLELSHVVAALHLCEL